MNINVYVYKLIFKSYKIVTHVWRMCGIFLISPFSSTCDPTQSFCLHLCVSFSYTDKILYWWLYTISNTMPYMEVLNKYTLVIANWIFLNIQPTLKCKKQFVLELGNK